MRLIDVDLVKTAMENSDDSLLSQPMTIRHVESLLNDLPTVPAIPLERIKQLREEIAKVWHTRPRNRYEEGKKDEAVACMELIDNMIKEYEG